MTGPVTRPAAPRTDAERRATYRRLSPLTPVVRGPLLLVAFLGTSWQQLLGQRDRGLVAVLLAGLLVAGAVYGVASWLRTKYWITEEELRIDTGVVVRRSRRIRIDRLQGIDIVQPLLARLFGLAELRFDVASGSDREGTLAFLPHAEALRLRRSLLERRDDLRGPPSVPSAAPTAEEELLLARLDLRRLLVSLALSVEALLFGGLAIATTAALLMTGTEVLAGAVLPAVLGLALTVGRRLTSYYGFSLTSSPAGLHVRRGLTALSSQTINPLRVQGVVVVEPWLWRPLGWARLEVSVAGYRTTDADQVEASSTLVPVAPRAEVLAVVRHVLGSERDVEAVSLAAPPRRARWLAPLGVRTMALGQDPRLLVSRRGVLSRRLDAVPQERVQSLQLTQGPLDRAFGLVRVHVDSPPGPVRVVGEARDRDEAREFVGEAMGHGGAARRLAGWPPAQPRGAATPPTADTSQANSPNPSGAVSSAALPAEDSPAT